MPLSGPEIFLDFLASQYNEVQLLALEALAACAKNQANRVIIGLVSAIRHVLRDR